MLQSYLNNKANFQKLTIDTLIAYCQNYISPLADIVNNSPNKEIVFYQNPDKKEYRNSFSIKQESDNTYLYVNINDHTKNLKVKNNDINRTFDWHTIWIRFKLLSNIATPEIAFYDHYCLNYDSIDYIPKGESKSYPSKIADIILEALAELDNDIQQIITK